ncbi:MAG: DeoR/GlpR family DNA-binding transcription regulator [Ruminococcus sp.]|nr:DeoR/GlpR family DNA-binding transcription regulator [Ruminococcus sp.]
MNLLTQERYQSILSIIDDKNAVTVSELAQLLNTSESTIRRDLTALDEMGKLQKVFGGATALRQNSGMFEDSLSSREKRMSEEKTKIAEYCAKLINSSDFVYIDAGSTTSRLIDFIEEKNATYVTNGITHARKLIQKGFITYIIGGKIKPVTEAVVGAEGISNLKNLNFSKAFMGTNGIDLKSGFTTPDIEEAMMKEAAIERTYMPFVISDHTKFRQVYSVTFSQLRKCCIITDRLTDRNFEKETIIKEVMR